MLRRKSQAESRIFVNLYCDLTVCGLCGRKINDETDENGSTGSTDVKRNWSSLKTKLSATALPINGNFFKKKQKKK